MTDYTLSFIRTLQFAGNYTSDYIGNYTRSTDKTSSITRNSSYIGTYTLSTEKTSIGYYAGNYIGTYVLNTDKSSYASYAGNYIGTYALSTDKTFTRSRDESYALQRFSTFVTSYIGDFTRQIPKDSIRYNEVETSTAFYGASFSRISYFTATYAGNYIGSRTDYYTGTYGASFIRNNYNYVGNVGRASTVYEPETGEYFPTFYSREVSFIGEGTRVSGIDKARSSVIETDYIGHYTSPARQSVISRPDGDPVEAFFTTFYAGNYIGNFTKNREVTYNRDRTSSYTRTVPLAFAGNYIGTYILYTDKTSTRARSSSFVGTYTRSTDKTFIGNYTGDYIGTYSRNTDKSYSRDFIGNYIGTYTRDALKTFSRDYTITSTRESTYTRTVSAGSGETPTYTVSGVDAEYGLIVYGPDGVTEIINPQTRVANLAYFAGVTVSGNSSVNVTITDVGDPTKILLIVETRLSSITYSTSGNTLTINNSAGYTQYPKVTAIRIR